ncbi:histidine kinase [Myroides marinus]|uniref:sensor histidine kinase n=1 Tax=Myroides marinus TaxID=703342 RepID=UPI0025776191|nr:histidine kinase [Myroides marinus]MDM1347301.1 histidine kinase [Myroides marinus]MDM1361876.1 histidine kinase [Myroides marinus]MDM1373213.1 histidine kinase [Myroides marinus]MDM1374386.1 histidine kinase [Myroides marinus]MDM1381353.1 histidine kinase [Myroides marinus]
METLLYIIICLLLVIIGWLIYSVRLSSIQRNELIKEKQLFDSKIRYLQLENLESRLDPHLFKNILNSIQSHAYQTYYALDKMAGVLDYILYDSQRKMVSLKEEHEFTLRLIDINKIKLNPLFRLDIRSSIGENEGLYHEDLIAPLLCVELIENAFKHADLASSDAFISILFKLKNNQFDLLVSNKKSRKKTLTKDKGGYGLTALNKRLELIYGNTFKLEKSEDDSIYSMHLKINLHDFKTKMHITR